MCVTQGPGMAAFDSWKGVKRPGI